MREQILEMLYNNSKLSAEEMAVMLGYSAEEIREEISAMEKEGIICGYTTMINWDKVENEKVTAFIEVKVAPQRGLGFDKIAERIYRFDEVESVSLMSGAYDLSVTIEGRTMKDVAIFVHEKLAPLESVLSTATHFVLRKYKEHGVVLVDEKKTSGRMKITP
ncbi:MAG: Lrp/AsnC family transcriptional regulator [Lachnospiraceae bacterium]|jgi:lrp/asnC family transcriptional regulator, leucine-responsive regulatory protein